MATRQVRALRGTAAAVIATLVAATAHTLSGGGAPHPLLVVSVAALAAPLAVWLTGRRPAWWRTALVVTGAQALFHGAFALAGDALPLSAGHAHLSPQRPAGTVTASTDIDPVMIVGHVIAALVTILAVRHGEQLLQRLGRGIRHLAARTAAAPPAPLVRRPSLTVRVAPVRRSLILDCALSRRGPPVRAG
ncbi:hypothetical protein [Microbacterium sp. zg-YB36]|uniref:hypothetical protein n=1 Tax=Microbacterium sp. zg-YB36 TaxID=2969407 RepID=UPI00214ACAF5|nr:hypothetical protein [Microbacterium sp. zg-YB36]MDL5353002.1 hypothetical protein [Microbacterium sp. zg-YB36]